MLDVPKLPTDNLYKFIAVAGLVTCLFMATVFVVNYQQVENRIHMLELHTRHLKQTTATMRDEEAHFDAIDTLVTDSIQQMHRYSTDLARHIDRLKIAIARYRKDSLPLSSVTAEIGRAH